MKPDEKRKNEQNKLIEPPHNLSSDELSIWRDFYDILKEGTNYRKTLADVELIKQYVRLCLLRDRSWSEWNKKPERYVRIVTGICADGKTPKIVIKENEHYACFIEATKQIEKIFTDFKLTPKTRPYNI